jgi:hypothetical protein
VYPHRHFGGRALHLCRCWLVVTCCGLCPRLLNKLTPASMQQNTAAGWHEHEIRDCEHCVLTAVGLLVILTNVGPPLGG